MGVLSHRDCTVLHRLFAVRCHRVQWSRDALYYAVSIRLFRDSLSHRIRDCFSWLRTRVGGVSVLKWSSLWDSAWESFQNHSDKLLLPHHPQSPPSHGR